MSSINLIEVFLNDTRVGRLALTPDGLCGFEYDANYIQFGASISPFFLPLKPELAIAKRDPFSGNFGVFNDSLPDGWGSLLLDRFLQDKGINPYKLSQLERLSLIGSSGRGALEYRPNKSFTAHDEFVSISKLASESEKMLTSNYNGESLSTLYRLGCSSGGARPKVFISIEGKEWLVKFKATNDPSEVGKIEYDYSLLAKECGISMPETRLFEGKYFGVERFDRTPNGKIHTISAAGLLHTDYRIPSLDYSILLKVCQALTKNMEQTYALFRLMVFNIVISNRDDHAKNFSFQLIGKEWKLSPAYDLLPSNGFNGYHTTTINGKGEPTLADIINVASEVGLQKKKSLQIVDEIVETCRNRKMDRFNIKRL